MRSGRQHHARQYEGGERREARRKRAHQVQQAVERAGYPQGIRAMRPGAAALPGRDLLHR